MNDQYQYEHVNQFESGQFHEETPATPAVISETIQDAGAPVEKKEPWTQSVPEVVTPEEKTEQPMKPFAPMAAAPVAEKAGFPEMLLGAEETLHFRARWNEVQAKFVDEPGSSVREADGLVAELMGQISQKFAKERTTLEGKWNQGEVSTENLRQVLQSYRAFFNRLLR